MLTKNVDDDVVQFVGDEGFGQSHKVVPHNSKDVLLKSRVAG